MITWESIWQIFDREEVGHNTSKMADKWDPYMVLTIYVKDYQSDYVALSVNPLTPMSDQDRISPYIINTISTK